VKALRPQHLPKCNSIRYPFNYCLMTGFKTMRGLLWNGQGFEEGHFWSMTFLSRFFEAMMGHAHQCVFPSSTSGAFSYLSLLNASFPQTLLSSAWHRSVKALFSSMEWEMIGKKQSKASDPLAKSPQPTTKPDKMIVWEGIQQRMLMSACDAVSR